MKSAWLRSNFSLAAFVPSLMLVWPCGVSLQGAEPGQNSCCQEELNRCWVALHLGGLFCLRIRVCIPSHPQGMGGKCRFHAILEWCQEFHLLLRLSLSFFQICFKCSVMHEIHSCLWVLFLLKQGSSSKKHSLWQLLTVSEQQPPPVWQLEDKTLRAGTKLSFHDMGPADLQRLKEWVSLRWKERKQRERAILNFARWILQKCSCWGLFCELDQVCFRKCAKAELLLTDPDFKRHHLCCRLNKKAYGKSPNIYENYFFSVYVTLITVVLLLLM